MNRNALQEQKGRRVRRTRSKISGTATCPRLAVFRSNQYTYVQLVDDEAGKTLAQASTVEIRKTKKGSKGEEASAMGALIGKRAVAAGITKAVFDRRSYRYQGRVKAVAEGARTAGLMI